MNKLEKLFAERQELWNRINDIDKEIKEHDNVVKHGKLQKAFELINEVLAVTPIDKFSTDRRIILGRSIQKLIDIYKPNTEEVKVIEEVENFSTSEKTYIEALTEYSNFVNETISGCKTYVEDNTFECNGLYCKDCVFGSPRKWEDGFNCLIIKKPISEQELMKKVTDYLAEQ